MFSVLDSISGSNNLRLHKVEAEISNVSGLALWRKSLEKMRRVELATARIKLAVTEHPDWSRKLIQESNSKEYYYLYALTVSAWKSYFQRSRKESVVT